MSGRSARIGITVDPRYIKVTPDDLRSKLNQTVSIDKIREEKAGILSRNLARAQESLEATTHGPDERVIYRFHTGEEGKKSVAEVSSPGQDLTAEEKDKFLVAHAGQNVKQITDGSRIIYSPFVSTTKSLASFIATTFTSRAASEDAGDANLRQDVFERADSISAFVVDSKYCTEPNAELSRKEGEVCYDTSEVSLTVLRCVSETNPLKGMMQINLTALALSRVGGAGQLIRVREIDSDYAKFGPDSTPKKIDEDFIARYDEWYRDKETLSQLIGGMPRVTRGAASKPISATAAFDLDRRPSRPLHPGFRASHRMTGMAESQKPPLPLASKAYKKSNLGGFAALTEESSSDDKTTPRSVSPTIVDPTQQGIKKADNPAAALAGNIWYSDENMINILSRTPNVRLITGEPEGMDIRVPPINSATLASALSRIPPEDGNYVIPMRINIGTCSFDEREQNRNNHWVGIYARKEAGNITAIVHMDPTGRGINPDVKAQIEGTLSCAVTDHRIQLQQGNLLGLGESAAWDGNMNDCGPLVIHMLRIVSTGNIAQLRREATLIAEEPTKSEEIGQLLRNHDNGVLRDVVDPSILESLHPSSHTSSAPAEVRFHGAGMPSVSMQPEDVTVSPIVGTGHVDVSSDPVILSRRADRQSPNPEVTSVSESGITSSMESDRHLIDPDITPPSRITSPGIRGLLRASRQTDPAEPEEDKLQIVGKTVKFSDRAVPSPHIYRTDERTPQIRARNHYSSEGHALRSAVGNRTSSLQSTTLRPTSTPRNIPSATTPDQGRGKFN